MWRQIVYIIISILLVVVFFPFKVVLAQPQTSQNLQSGADDLIAEVNALRIANGLPAYAVNSILMLVAQDQANYMAATGQVAHRPGLTQRILDAGYPLAGDLSQGGFRAENITGGNKSAEQAVQEWLGDGLHLNTMLSPNLTEIGAGVAKVGDRYYFVIDCARPTADGQPQVYTPNPNALAAESSSSNDFIVPITVSTPDENGLIYHEVQYGQTLWAIAIEYGVKIDEIRALNNLGSGTDIYPGDKLLVRQDTPPPIITALSTAVPSPIGSLQMETSTAFPTVTPNATVTPLVISVSRASNSGAGIAIGIVLVTLLLVGMFTWMNSRRPV